MTTATSTIYAAPADHAMGEGQASPFRHVLVGVDGTASGRDAIALADVLRDVGGQLTLAHVVPNQVPIYRNFHATSAGQQARALLQRERTLSEVDARVTGMFARSVAHGLHQLAEDCDADLLVVGSGSHDHASSVVMGDDTVSGTGCAVAVAPHGYREWSHPITTIGVAYDDSDEAQAALTVARSLIHDNRRRLSAITVVTPMSVTAGGWSGLAPAWKNVTDTLVAEAHDRLRALEGVEERNVAVGDVGQQLATYGDAVDLLVVGSRRDGPIRRAIFGSTALQLTREARCPLLVIPPA